MITRVEFLKAYMQHKPNKYMRVVYGWWNNIKHQIATVVNLLILFVLGFVFTQFILVDTIGKVVVLIYGGILAAIAAISLPAYFMNKYKINRIRKLLGGISATHYNALKARYIG